MPTRARHIDRHATPESTRSVASLAPEQTGLVRLPCAQLKRDAPAWLSRHQGIWAMPGHWLYLLEIDASTEAVANAHQTMRKASARPDHVVLNGYRGHCLLVAATGNVRCHLAGILNLEPDQSTQSAHQLRHDSTRTATHTATLGLRHWAATLPAATLSVGFARFSPQICGERRLILERSLWDRSQPMFGTRPE